jgi:hypothetical protein
MDFYPIYKNKDGFVGRALIINNYAFTRRNGEPIPRLGSQLDVERARATFKRLGYYVEVRTDLTAQQMKDLIAEEMAREELRDDSVFICMIMSLGGKDNQVFGIDRRSVNFLTEIIEPVRKCPALLNKAKLFFLEASRGDDATPITDIYEVETGGIPGDYECVGAYAAEVADNQRENLVAEEGDEPPTDTWTDKSGSYADDDYTVSYSSEAGHVSFLNPTNGSGYIRSLCNVLDRYGLQGNIQLCLLLIETGNRLATRYQTQMSDMSNHMRKVFYFNEDDGSDTVGGKKKKKSCNCM